MEELTSQELKSEINTCKTRLKYTKDSNNTNKKSEEIYNNRLKNLKLSGTRSELIDRLTKEAKYSLLNSNSMISLPGIGDNIELKNDKSNYFDDNFINFSDDDDENDDDVDSDDDNEENINSDNNSLDNIDNGDVNINDDSDDIDGDDIDLNDSDDNDYSNKNKKKPKNTKNIILNQNNFNEEYLEIMTNDENNNNNNSLENNDIGNKITSILRCIFGYKSFRIGQQWAIERVLMELNSLLVIPTGSGKSLCYMLPSILLPGLTIVISPLIALMQDQVKKLPVILPGVCLNGSMSTQEVANISSNILGNIFYSFSICY